MNDHISDAIKYLMKGMMRKVATYHWLALVHRNGRVSEYDRVTGENGDDAVTLDWLCSRVGAGIAIVKRNPDPSLTKFEQEMQKASTPFVVFQPGAFTRDTLPMFDDYNAALGHAKKMLEQQR
jgi:hypothetical protein